MKDCGKRARGKKKGDYKKSGHKHCLKVDLRRQTKRNSGSEGCRSQHNPDRILSGKKKGGARVRWFRGVRVSKKEIIEKSYEGSEWKRGSVRKNMGRKKAGFEGQLYENVGSN